MKLLPKERVKQPLTPLTLERVKELLSYNEETGDFTWIAKSSKKSRVKIGDQAGCLYSHGYIQLTIDGVRYSAANLACFYLTGEWPEKHINQPLTQARLKELLHYDETTGDFLWKVKRSPIKIGDRAGCLDRHGRVVIGIDDIRYSAARLSRFYLTGEWPEFQVDHKDINRSNDAANNLRDATHSQNNMNRKKPKNNTSGLKGVSWHIRDRKWMSYISINGKRIHLGCFDTPEEAHAAYCAAADRLHGEFARYS